MSLHWLWVHGLTSPAQALNALALFLAVAGGWLWIATRVREMRLPNSVLQANAERIEAAPELLLEARTQRINRFFYRFGAACLLGSLLLSGLSSQL